MREDIGAEGGIVSRGIAEVHDRSGDSPFPLYSSLKPCLPLFVPLCTSLPLSVVPINTLITPVGMSGNRSPGDPGGTGGIFRIGNGIWFPTIEMKQKSGRQKFLHYEKVSEEPVPRKAF